MIKKIAHITFVLTAAVLFASCKNTKQKLQEYVKTYNSTAPSFQAENVSLTTARGYIEDNKIELRFETNLEPTDQNKSEASASFPKLLKEMIHKDQIPQDLIMEGVRFDVYFLANDNTVLDKEILNSESIKEFSK
ncbi:hypothetical protein [Flavobacterium hungaricum]|uniref:Lipoprotein n=1 Tax=Flavobacterium hungaricum TaxID=2082725 RepID=A0ABR9TEN2_9FLAO|nr:hypothetical protein [Flavobacterium hungaricum]MBE8723798.1 hypothetical protein [Flavobacterium hungaricum]